MNPKQYTARTFAIELLVTTATIVTVPCAMLRSLQPALKPIVAGFVASLTGALVTWLWGDSQRWSWVVVAGAAVALVLTVARVLLH